MPCNYTLIGESLCHCMRFPECASRPNSYTYLLLLFQFWPALSSMSIAQQREKVHHTKPRTSRIGHDVNLPRSFPRKISVYSVNYRDVYSVYLSGEVAVEQIRPKIPCKVTELCELKALSYEPACNSELRARWQSDTARQDSGDESKLCMSFFLDRKWGRCIV